MLNYKSAICPVLLAFLVIWIVFSAMQIRQKNDLIEQLYSQKLALELKNNLCLANIDKQNLAIKALQTKAKNDEQYLLKTKKTQNVLIKDNSCEGELKAYKELFNVN